MKHSRINTFPVLYNGSKCTKLLGSYGFGIMVLYAMLITSFLFFAFKRGWGLLALNRIHDTLVFVQQQYMLTAADYTALIPGLILPACLLQDTSHGGQCYDSYSQVEKHVDKRQDDTTPLYPAWFSFRAWKTIVIFASLFSFFFSFSFFSFSSLFFSFPPFFFFFLFLSICLT